MPRFFVPIPLSTGARVTLPEGVTHHALRVLRLRAGDTVILFNGEGGEYQGALEVAPHGVADVQITGFDAREAELPFRVVVAQGLSAAEKMDWTLEKAVELGAWGLQPLAMQRSVTRLSGERANKREAHWVQIARAASEQCARNRILKVLPLATLDEWLEQLDTESVRLMLDPEAKLPLAKVMQPAAGVATYLLAGPEAGMSPAEKAAALVHGFSPVSLGPRVLRTETAAASALAILGALWSGVS
jgi:16S rRNA (uracil1498-N3)-methyltransferase